MSKPVLSRFAETFIAIPSPPGATAMAVWQGYVDLLRIKVAPLVQRLLATHTVAWYGFLVHDHTSGVPAPATGPHLHLRVQLGPRIRFAQFQKRLPPTCVMTRMVSQPIPRALDSVDVTALKGGDVANGWGVLGESSEWVLRMLAAHDRKTAVPVQNVAQFLHYLGNQLLVSVVRIPMP